MSALMNAWQSLKTLPRAARWAVSAGVIVLGLLLYIDHVVGLAVRWNERSEDLLANLGRASGGEGRLDRLDTLRDVVRAVGPVQKPRADADAENAFNDVVSGVLKKHPVTRDSFSYRGASKLQGGTLARVMGREVQKITGDLRFDATQEEAIAIIAELEDSPDIEAISSLRITRQANAKNKVTVDLTVEAWITAATSPLRPGGPA
jgi:hypothetical protein